MNPRKIVKAFTRLVPARIRNAIPLSAQAAFLGAAFSMTQHPQIGFHYARTHHRLAMKAGKPEISARASRALTGKVGPVAAEIVADPMFQCRAGHWQDSGTQARVRLYAEFGYFALRLSGNIEWREDPEMLAQATGIAVAIDGIDLRHEKLLKQGKGALFLSIIGREVLDRFPKHSTLSLRLIGIPGSLATVGHIEIYVPHGDGSLPGRIAQTGFLEKKGSFRQSASNLAERQQAYLALYARLVQTFNELFGRPVFVLYGTLLGQHRNGEFIPGDDDFDAGYISMQRTPQAVKAEAVEMIRKLVASGYVVEINRAGKPFRVRSGNAPDSVHIDLRPVWSARDGEVLMHKHARLDMSLSGFVAVVPGTLSGHQVLKPAETESFLESYYGPNWRVPDPGFSNASIEISARTKNMLQGVSLSLTEQKQLVEELGGSAGHSSGGRLICLMIRPLYPIGGASPA